MFQWILLMDRPMRPGPGQPVRRWHGKAEIETRTREDPRLSATSRELAFLPMPSKLSSPLLTKEPRSASVEFFRVNHTIASSLFSCSPNFLPTTNELHRLVRQHWSTQGRKGRQSCVSLSRPDAKGATPARPGAT